VRRFTFPSISPSAHQALAPHRVGSLLFGIGTPSFGSGGGWRCPPAWAWTTDPRCLHLVPGIAPNPGRRVAGGSIAGGHRLALPASPPSTAEPSAARIEVVCSRRGGPQAEPDARDGGSQRLKGRAPGPGHVVMVNAAGAGVLAAVARLAHVVVAAVMVGVGAPERVGLPARWWRRTHDRRGPHHVPFREPCPRSTEWCGPPRRFQRPFAVAVALARHP